LDQLRCVAARRSARVHSASVWTREGRIGNTVERGDATGTFNLGSLLERRDPAAAEAAYRRAAERGHPELADMAQAALSHLRGND